ncbi:hypothetical protein Q5752_000058 [Cryptotrichosporon argae]
MPLYPAALLIATGLSGHGLRKGSLSASGAVAAWAVGYGHLANPLNVFGVGMIVFYLLGSRATKVKADVKARLEDGLDPTKPGGNRGAIQVLANSLPSLLSALAFRYAYPALSASTSPLALPLGRSLILAALAHLAAVLADTLASELGMLSTRPYHVLSLRPVRQGTNGGVSLLGLGVSAVGGLVMGTTFALDLALESALTRAQAAELVGLGTAAGLVGSVLDSLLGATLQATYLDTSTSRILTDASSTPRAAPGVVRVGSGRDVLSNSGVNFVTGCIMAAAGWWYAGL